MSRLHIHAPAGVYHAQVRRSSCRKWETVGAPLPNKIAAARRAVSHMMQGEYKRARVLFCAEWYDPIVVMEASV